MDKFSQISEVDRGADMHRLDHYPSFSLLCSRLESSDGKISDIPGINQDINNFLKSGEIADIIFKEISSISENEFTNKEIVRGSLLLFDGERYSIVIEKLMAESETGPLVTAASEGAFKVIKSASPLFYTSFKLIGDNDISIFNQEAKVEVVNKVTLDSRSDVTFYDMFEIINFSLNGMAIIFRIVAKEVTPFHWFFDRISMAPIFISTVHPSTTRTQALIELISEFHGSRLSSTQAEDALLEFGKHHLYFVRWRACQVLAKINLRKAVPLIEELSSDPHPYVRRAALAALARAREIIPIS